MSFDVWRVVLILLTLANSFEARRTASYSQHNQHRPIKRVTVSRQNDKDGEYSSQKSYRRQEVIHALNDDSTKTDDNDDIESLGKTIDSMGSEVKTKIPKPAISSEKSNAAKDIIAKIKEIQDKLFSRTGSKELLESKFKQMSPDTVEEQITNSTSKLHNAINSTTEAVSKVTTTAAPTKDLVKEKIKTQIRADDGSKNPERRKIIPEEVVDKILEKFQQLRQEAKHMALLETQHGADQQEAQGKTIEKNPYASIGPAKANGELKNRTQLNADVTSVGMGNKVDMALQTPPDPPAELPQDPASNMSPVSIQLPMPNSPTEFSAQSNVKPVGGMPFMFIKNGNMLVPVFSGSSAASPMTITGNGMAQLNSNPGVAMPNMPNNVFPLTNPQQTAVAFMGGSPINLQSNQMESNNNNPFNNYKNNQFNMANNQMAMLNNQMGQFSDVNLQQPNNFQMKNNPFMPLPSAIETASSRCAIPGSGCPTPTIQQKQFPQEQQNMGFSNAPTVSNQPSTTELINSLMNAPGFPQLAARLMSEATMMQNFENGNQNGGSRSLNNFNSGNQNGESRSLNNDMQPFGRRPNDDVQGMSPGAIQFGLQQNLAANGPGQPSMLLHEPTQAAMEPNSDGLQRTFLSAPQQPINPNGPLESNPYQDVHLDRNDNIDQMRREDSIFNARNVATNDISDPMPQKENERQDDEEKEQTRFQQKDPDELLDIAKYKSMEHEEGSEEEEMANRNPNAEQDRMAPTMGYGRSDTPDMMSPTERVDPSNLLDRIHGAQLKVDLLGAGDPNWFSPTYKQMQREKTQFGGNPDDLLEMLRSQNEKIFNKNFGIDGSNRKEFQKARLREQNAKSREGVPFSVDPSFADEIPSDDGFGQQFDVQNKQLVSDNNAHLFSQNQQNNQHGDISVLPDDFLQFKHGRMSMDSANVVNSFYKDAHYRNKIAHPDDDKHATKRWHDQKGVVRASISKSLPDDNVELRVNGNKLTDNHSLRSKIIDGKIVNPPVRTVRSKGPIKIELSHGQGKRKIINIVTKSKYNVTEERKRMSIPKSKLSV